ncbi:SDR family oxidoreductase [Sorangium sp. So ce1128]
MILVTGATGTIGSEVVKQLLEAGAPVRVLARNPSKAAAKLGAGVAIVLGDLGAPETLDAAFADVDKAFVLSAGPDLASLEANAVSAAKKAGVGHIVLLSVFGAESAPGLQNARRHRESEKNLAASGLAWTFVRPGAFASNAFGWAPSIKAQGEVYAPMGEGKNAPIDPRDVAAVAVTALTSPGHDGKAYGITGPEALSMREQVAKIAAAIDRPLRFVDVPSAAARDGMLKAAMPPGMVDAILEYMAHVRAGEAATTTTTVADVLGRPARTFDAWIHDHVAAFR